VSKRIAVCPGSFDPITLGHLAIVQRAAALFDEVIIAVAEDAEKRHTFGIDERVELATDASGDIENVTVESFSGLLANYCERRGVTAIVKGLRGHCDIDHELQMQTVNKNLAPGVETVFLMALTEVAHISSSMVKWLASLGADVSGYVPENVAERLRQDV